RGARRRPPTRAAAHDQQGGVRGRRREPRPRRAAGPHRSRSTTGRVGHHHQSGRPRGGAAGVDTLGLARPGPRRGLPLGSRLLGPRRERRRGDGPRRGRVSIRPARPEDAQTLGPLHVRCWQEAYAHILPEPFLQRLDPAVRTDRFRELIADPEVTLIVAEDDDGIAGFCSFGHARDVADRGEVYAIYLRSSAWGRGLGSGLLLEAQDRLSETFEEAMLWVLSDNTRARAFYERHGWSPSGEKQYLD